MQDVDLGQLSLAQQVMERQEGHAEAIGKHLEEYARLSAGDLGLILQLVKPITDSFVDVGTDIARASASVSRVGASKMGSTITTYQEAEREVVERMTTVAQQIGGAMPPPYSPADAPTLGAPVDQAPQLYGYTSNDLFGDAFKDGYSIAEWVDQTSDQLGDRFSQFLSTSPHVDESVDVRSYLPYPQGDNPEIESVRWKAGAIFGGVDWMWEQVFGYSLLEEITKPFVGDWERITQAAVAWTHAGDASKAIGDNYRGMLPAVGGSWVGDGSEQFLVAAAVVADGHGLMQSPAGALSLALKGLAAAVKWVVGKILGLLEKLSYTLLRMAAAATVPVAGWVFGAIYGGLEIMDLVKDVRDAYKWINRIYTLVSSLAGGLGSMFDSFYRMADLTETLVRAGAARA
jgi:hypothetical protein